MQCASAKLLSVACPTLQHFFRIVSYIALFFFKATEHKMCVLIFSTTFGGNISHSRKKRARYEKKYLLVFM